MPVPFRVPFRGTGDWRRGGADEGAGRGFDNLDLSAAAERTIAAADSAEVIVGWFAAELMRGGWTHGGDGWLSRDEGEGFFIRVERDRGISRVATQISDPANRSLQERFEQEFYSGAPEGWSVVTAFYTIAPAPGP